jgi:prefoldin subunit 5
MTVDSLTTIIALVGSIFAAAAMLHTRLGKIDVILAQLETKLDAHMRRLDRLEQELDEIRKAMRTHQ